jgi:hypothetical protein
VSFAGYRTLAVGLAGAVALAACTGNGEGLDANGQPIGSGSSGPLTADFQSIQDNVFTPICTRCHAGAGAPEGLQLDAAHSYALLVGVPSTEQPNVLRVKAGDPDDSYLVLKLEGSAGISGVRMPFGGPYLPQSTIDVIRQWISAGAPSAIAAGAAKELQLFVVTMTSPADGAVVATPRPWIVVAFSHELDASLVNYTTIALQRADAGGSPGDAGEPPAAAADIAVTTVLAAGNPRVLLIAPRAPLPNGSYRVTVRGTGGAALADLSAQPLALDYSFTFVVDASR